MIEYIYLLIFVIGFILLIIFAALGGLSFDVDAGDMDVDIDADIDADLDMDVDADVDMDLDTDADASLSGHPGPLSLPIIFFFMTSFGGVGMILTIIGVVQYLVLLVSIIVGIAFAGGLFLLMARIFATTQASSVIPLKRLIGLKATVSVPIKKGSEGQVVVEPPDGGRLLVGAIADTSIKTDTVVEILEVVGGIVRVQKHSRGTKKKKQAVMK
jgi:hypothetical protein